MQRREKRSMGFFISCLPPQVDILHFNVKPIQVRTESPPPPPPTRLSPSSQSSGLIFADSHCGSPGLCLIDHMFTFFLLCERAALRSTAWKEFYSLKNCRILKAKRLVTQKKKGKGPQHCERRIILIHLEAYVYVKESLSGFSVCLLF